MVTIVVADSRWVSADDSDQNCTGHPANVERWGVTTRSEFKRENFGGRLCIRWRRFDRGQPGAAAR